MANMSIIWSDGTSGAVWEERITREDNWLHSTGWLIRIIEKKTMLKILLIMLLKVYKLHYMPM